MSWKKSEMLMDTIKHYSGFPATGVSLRQMVQFGERPSTGALLVSTDGKQWFVLWLMSWL